MARDDISGMADPDGSEATPVLIGIDVEPVHRVVRGKTEDWAGFPELIDLLTERRARLEDASGRPVRFVWHLRMDPQIEIAYGDVAWVFHRYGDEIERIRASGDDLGLHVHTWRPARRFFRETWLAEFEDEDWIRHCLTLAFETFRANVGSAPVSMSFGDNFMHACAPPIMEAHGLRADQSMYPGRKPARKVKKGELSNGRLPDYTDTPPHPFRPSIDDFRVPGPQARAFWEVPVTAGTIGRERDGSDRRTKLLLGTNPDWVTVLIEQALDGSASHLLAECRTDVLTHPKTRSRFVWALDHLEELARRQVLEFTAVSGLCDRLDRGQLVPAP